jgi:hypothetical protein
MRDKLDEQKGSELEFLVEVRGLSRSIALIHMTAIIFLAGQLTVALTDRPQLISHLNYTAQKLMKVKANQVQAEQAVDVREQKIKRSGALEVQYAAMLTDLLELSKVDPDARAITQKWKIKHQGAPHTEESHAGASGTDPKQAPAPSKTKPIQGNASRN